MRQANFVIEEMMRHKRVYLPRILSIVGLILYLALLPAVIAYLQIEQQKATVVLSELREKELIMSESVKTAKEGLEFLEDVKTEKQLLTNILDTEEEWYKALRLILADEHVHVREFSGDDTGVMVISGETNELVNIIIFRDYLRRNFCNIKYTEIEKRDILYEFVLTGQTGENRYE